MIPTDKLVFFRRVGIPPTSQMYMCIYPVVGPPSDKLVQTTPITWVYGRCTLTSCGLRTSFNGKSRILNWTYVSTIFFAIFCGDIPWLLLPMCFQSNKHDFNAGPKIVYLAFEHPVIMSTINISDIGVKKSPT